MAERSRNVVDAGKGLEIEQIRAGLVYKLFSRVVEYGKVLQGIISMTMAGNEAVASIAISAHSRPGANESSVLRVCDAVALDSFIQVVGLSMNTGDGVGSGEVMICNGIDSSIIAENFDFTACSSYRIYTSYNRTSSKEAVGDVFAWSEDGSVVAAFLGCRFVKLEITRLERLLDSSGSHSSNSGRPPRIQESGFSHGSSDRLESDADATLAGSTPDILTPPPHNRTQDVRQLLETYTGVAATAQLGNALIADLGLDSLASTELAAELQPADGRPLKGDELLLMTVTQLEERLGSANGKAVGSADVVQHLARNHAATTPGRDVLPLKHDFKSDNFPVRSQYEKSTSESDPVLAGKKVIELLVETTGISPSSINPQSSLQDLGVDSLALTEILSALADTCAPGFNMQSISGESKVADLLRTAGALAQPIVV